MRISEQVWILDDDSSIRWVLEKALARENLATRSFANVRDAMAALIRLSSRWRWSVQSPEPPVQRLRQPKSADNCCANFSASVSALPVCDAQSNNSSGLT